MKFIKRDGTAVDFDSAKIYAAVEKANNATDSRSRITEEEITRVTREVTEKCKKLRHTPRIEEVQDMVEDALMALGAFTLAKTYITYRYRHALLRKAFGSDEKRFLSSLGEI